MICTSTYLAWLKTNKNTTSHAHWRPYLNILPDQYDNIINFDEEEMKELYNTSLYKSGTEYEIICDILRIIL
jgi:hypothetical protein